MRTSAFLSMRPVKRLGGAAALAAVAGTIAIAATGTAGATGTARAASSVGAWIATGSQTSTPIKHLVVIFQENVSFDHYFGTYPNATNPAGEPAFHPQGNTPAINGLSQSLLTSNPNLSNPQRLDRSQAVTCDQDHNYADEQKAEDSGLMDKFVQDTGRQATVAQCTGLATGTSPNYAVMDYYDGNTVTGLWNYAQHFAMSDNSYGTNFGPSTDGALNVTSANTYGVVCGPSSAAYNTTPCTAAPGSTPATPGTELAPGAGTVYSDADPNFDICSATQDHKTAAQTIAMGGQNIGDLLNKAGITWGWFQGGFASPGYIAGQPSTDDLGQVCTGTHQNVGGGTSVDYNPHHEPFQYYASTANPMHLPPSSIDMIGRQDQANHQYDLSDFWAAADNGNMPAVSYLKAADYQDGHAGYSDPLDEQTFLAQTINHLESLPTWKSTAVIISYDDSDGWYDHQLGPVISGSQTPLDALTGVGQCGGAAVPSTDAGLAEQARCGVGVRMPFLVISPLAKRNYVDHTLTDQSSVVRFIEDNWLSGERLGNGAADAPAGPIGGMFNFAHRNARQLFLDPSTGEPTS